MLLKISLIIAILASIGTLAVSELQVKAKYAEYETAHTQLQGKLADSEKKVEEKSKKLTAALDELTGVKTALTKATDDAKAAQDAAAVAQTAKEAAEAGKAKAEAKTKETIEANRGFFELGKKPEELKKMMADLDYTTKELETTSSELKVLHLAYVRIKGEVDAFTSPNGRGPTIAGVRGTVTAVDPKWQFVVVNVGLSQGVVQNGVMLVSRNSKVIGRIKITGVETDQAVGNVIKDSKAKGEVDILEGDTVIGQ